MSVVSNVFNNYYFTLLKKLKDTARTDKENTQNRRVLKGIKAHYISYDKTAPEYMQYVKDLGISWDSVDSIVHGSDWLNQNGDVCIYKDITISQVRAVCDDDALMLYFLTALTFLSSDLTADDVAQFVGASKAIKTPAEFSKTVEATTSDRVRSTVKRMYDFYTASVNAGVSESMKGIEDTSLGKLAKEIMDEVDVSQLTNTLDADGDILKTLSNPDSGLTKLLGTVSQKLISKMASGEISNETLIKDAMQFSSKLGKMPGGSAMPDMSSMMSMFQGLMSEGGMQPPRGGNPAGTRTRVDTSAMSRVAKAKQLKRKLEEKRQRQKQNQAKENVATDVE